MRGSFADFPLELKMEWECDKGKRAYLHVRLIRVLSRSDSSTQNATLGYKDSLHSQFVLTPCFKCSASTRRRRVNLGHICTFLSIYLSIYSSADGGGLCCLSCFSKSEGKSSIRFGFFLFVCLFTVNETGF